MDSTEINQHRKYLASKIQHGYHFLFDRCTKAALKSPKLIHSDSVKFNHQLELFTDRLVLTITHI